MAKLNSRMRVSFTRFAAILRTVLCLSMMLVLVQVVDPDSDSGTNSNSNSGSGSDPGKKPPADKITRVPEIISDQACPSGQRNVVKVYKNGALMKTERGACVF